MSLLRHREDARTLVFVGIAHVLQIGGFFLWPQMSWFVAVPWILAAMWFSWLTAVITHNTIHAPIFHSRTLNKWMQVVLTLGYGSPVSAFVPGHNLSHHLHTQTRRDVMRTTKMRFRWNLLNVLLAPPTLARDITRSDMAYAKAMRKERPRWFRQWVLEYVVFVVVQVVFFVLDPLAFVLFLLVPHIAAAFGIVGINFFQHDGCDQDSEYNHSRNFVGPWINFWAFNNGYHTIHHMQPGLHWSKTKAAHEALVAPHIHPNLDSPNMLTYMWTIYIWPGKRVDYLGNPLVLPEEGPDEPWIPGVGSTPANVSLGAEG